jgi:hypothetical protein
MPIGSGDGTTNNPIEVPATSITPGTFGLPWFVLATSPYVQPSIMPQEPVSVTSVFNKNMDALLAVRNAERQQEQGILNRGPVAAPGAAQAVAATQDRNATVENMMNMSRRVVAPNMQSTLGTNYSDEKDLAVLGKDYFNLQNATNMPQQSLEDQIKHNESMFWTWADQATAKAYGSPVSFTTDSLGNKVPVFSPDAPQYLGLKVGEIGGFVPQAPPPGASDTELRKYNDALRNTWRVPIYTESSILPEIQKMGKDELGNFQKAMHYMGIYPPNTGFTYGSASAVELGYMKTLMEMANMNGTDWAYQLQLQMNNFEERVRQGLSAPYGGAATGGGGGGGGAGSPGTSTVYTNVQYSTTSISQARSLLMSIMQESLGRNPTDSEVRQFLSILNGEERNSPTRTTTRTNYITDSKTRAVSRTTPSGVDPERVAMDFVKSIDNGTPYDASQSNRYIDALVNWLGG